MFGSGLVLDGGANTQYGKRAKERKKKKAHRLQLR
jgi:hypothetical protein